MTESIDPKDNLIQSIPEVPKPKTVMQPPESYQSSGSSWFDVDTVCLGLEALSDILDIFD